MTLITIENRGYAIIVHRERLKGSRREWTVANQFDIYLKGPFGRLDYSSATNLALQVILDANLPAIALKRVFSARTRTNKVSPETVDMFSKGRAE